MKCHKPGTDQLATLTVKANGFPCPEFDLPFSFATSSDPNTIECFIPVTNGDQLTISGTFNGTCVHGAFDLLVDGTFVGDKRIEGLKTGETKYWTRKLSYEKVFDTPVPPGYTSIYTPREIVEGNLHAKLLDDPLEPAQGEELSVGSLAVIISVNQKSSDNYMHGYSSTICGDWRKTKSNREKAGDGGITPTHELEVKILADAVNKNRQSAHRRHFEQLRFGHKPWAKLIFYYRSRMAIETARCVSRPDQSVALEPAAPGSFVAAAPKEDGRGKSSARKKILSMDMLEEDSGDGENINVKSVRHGSSFTSSPLTPSKQARRIQPTSSPRDRRESSGLFVGTSSSAMPSTPARARQPTPSPRKMRESSSGGLFVSPSPVKRSYMTESHDRDLDGEIARRRGSVAQSIEGEDDQALPGDEEMDEAPEETFCSNSSDSASENIIVAQVHNPNIDHEPLNSRVTSPESTVEPPKPSMSPEEIIALASEHGVISTEKLLRLFSDRSITYAAGLEVVEAVARKVGSNYILKDQPTSEHHDNTQAVNIMVQEEEIPIISNEDVEPVRIKMEPADIPKPANRSTTTQPDHVSPPLTTSAILPNPAPRKRRLSNENGSRESTPNKKARVAELKAKKAALLAANQEKARKKLAAENALQEERKRREVEEEELLREIEEAEKQGMELDEETAELVKLREMEEAEE